jgi:predicted RNA-binding protein YlxR (DUF448 family)
MPPKPLPLRTCIATGLEFPKEALLRFVLSPENKVIPDIKGTLPGRGMYVQPQAALVAEAVKRNLFAKSAKHKVKTDVELPELVARLLRERALNYLQRAQMAGDLVSGFEKVKSMLLSGDAAVLLHAEDAAQDGSAKLDPMAEGARILVFGTRDELANALQKANPVHLAIKKGGIAAHFLASYDRWAGFCELTRV